MGKYNRGLDHLVLFFFYLLTLIFVVQSSSSHEQFTRQPPRSIKITSHDSSDFDPQQVHISLAGEDHMKISWVTTSHENVHSLVEYGKTSGTYQASAKGEHTSYTYFSYQSGRIHHVIIGPLEPQTTYYYRCGGSGPEYNFRTPPSTFPIEFAVAGDLGQTEWTESTLAHIGASDYDVLLLPGDLSYANGKQPMWDSFGRLVEPYASARPWMVTQGNHEIETSTTYPHGFKAYNARWQMPHQESGSNSNLYYSFDVAGTHIVMLGSYAGFDAGSDQYEWLKVDFAKVEESRTPWIIVVIHAPWYNSNEAHEGEAESMRLAMEEMLYDAGVDIVFAGHVHAYERFTRVYEYKANECGPIHVTIGDGGNREGLAMQFVNPSPRISLYREPSFGHGRLRIYNATHAHWSWQRNNDHNSLAADQVWIQSLSSSAACKTSSLSSHNDEL